MIRIVTLSVPGREHWLSQCVNSVIHQLPPGSEHRIIRHQGDWVEQQWQAIQGAELVAFVDDDDIVEPHAIEWCLSAHQEHRVGLVFTDEIEVDKNNDFIRSGMTGRRTYIDLAMHPRSAHHLSVFRTAAIDPEAVNICKKHNLGADWLFRATAALTHGALHISRPGYRWRRHQDQVSITAHLDRYRAAMPELRHYLRGFLREDSVIPEYNPKD